MINLVLLGDPVEHSRSPAMHRAALAAADIDGTYEALLVDQDGMARAAADLRKGLLDGANITMPHKRTAAHLSDALAGPAQRSGSVNTWVRSGDRIIGHSTDGDGVLFAWDHAGLPAGAPVLVLGNGGAALAALVALEGRRLYVAARRPGAAFRAAASVGVEAAEVPWGSPVSGAVIVNATTVGMHGESLPLPVLDEASGLLDMPYAAGVTPSVEAMRAAGKPAAGGIDMLIGQALASFRLWTGAEVPESVMREAL